MKLRDYQVEITNKAIDILTRFKLVYLSLEVRTGKTITALNICNEMQFKNVLFVTKKKAIKSIESDCKHFKFLNVLTINYESIHKIDFNPDVVICDESHCFGAFAKPSKRAKELKKITTNKPIIYLSGTPTPESYSQIYHQFWISSFSPFKEYQNFYKWAKVYVNPKIKYQYNRAIND